MINVTIYDKDTNEISALVKSLKEQGYKTGLDFDFAYKPGRFDWGKNTQIPRQTDFTFYNEKLGTWFLLIYG